MRHKPVMLFGSTHAVLSEKGLQELSLAPLSPGNHDCLKPSCEVQYCQKGSCSTVTIKCSWKKCRAVGSKVWGRFGGYKKAGHVLSGVFQKRLLTVSRSWNCEAQHIHCTEIAHGISFKNYKTMVEGAVRLPNEENGDASCTFHLGSRAGVSLWPSWEQSRGQWGAKWKLGSVQLSNWYGFKFWSLTLSGLF